MRILTIFLFLFIAIPAQAAPLGWTEINFHGIVTDPGGYFPLGQATFTGFIYYNPSGADRHYSYDVFTQTAYWVGGTSAGMITPMFAYLFNVGDSGSFQMGGEVGGHDQLVASFDGQTGSILMRDESGWTRPATGIITGVPEPASWILIPFAVIWIAISKRRLFT